MGRSCSAIVSYRHCSWRTGVSHLLIQKPVSDVTAVALGVAAEAVSVLRVVVGGAGRFRR